MDMPDLSNLDLPEKELKILEAAIGVFSEKGFSAATTSEIAKSAGIAEGTVFRYFKTKKDILRGILIHTINIVSGKLILGSIEKIVQNAEDKDLRSILKEIVYDRVKLVDSIFPMARIILTEALYHEDVRTAMYENVITKAVILFKGFCEKMAERGMMRSDIDCEAVIRSIAGNMLLLVIQNKFFGDKFEKFDLDKEFDKAIDILLNGIAVQNTKLDE